MFIILTASLTHTCERLKHTYKNASCCDGSTRVAAYDVRSEFGADPDNVVYASTHEWRLTEEGVTRWKAVDGISYEIAGKPLSGAVAPMSFFKDAPFTFTFGRKYYYTKPLCIVPVQLEDNPTVTAMEEYTTSTWPTVAPTQTEVEDRAITLTSSPRHLTHSDFVVSWDRYGNDNNINHIFQPHGDGIRIDYTHSVPSTGNLLTRFSLPREWTLEFDMQFVESPSWYRVKHGLLVENSDWFSQYGLLDFPDSGIYYSVVADPANTTSNSFVNYGSVNIVPGYKIAQDGPPMPQSQWYDKMHFKLSQHVVTGPYNGIDHTFRLLSVVVNGQRKAYADKTNPGFLTGGTPWSEALSGHFGFQLEWSSFVIENAMVRAYDAAVDH